MDRLAGRVAFVTGAARGIGLAIAKAFLAEGAVVGLADRNREVVERAAAPLGSSAVPIVLDITRSGEVKAAMEGFVERAGRLDILVNNAGITDDAPIQFMTERQWDAVLAVNLYGSFYVTRAALRYLLKSPAGRVISLASIVGEYGEPEQANYAASKGALLAFTRSLAKEIASRNVTVNAISPGLITTPLTDMIPRPVREAIAAVTPLGRPGGAEEVAALATFLASDEAGFITGQVIRVNGGLLMG
ncbi:MAG: SDR family NAD(P)-dependent oxidoreductase [bacterium]